MCNNTIIFLKIFALFVNNKIFIKNSMARIRNKKFYSHETLIQHTKKKTSKIKLVYKPVDFCDIGDRTTHCFFV